MIFDLATFETFTRRTTPPATAPYVTLQGRGSFSLNEPAYSALGRPEAVLLQYSRPHNAVGMKACPKDTDGSYPVRQTNRGRTFLVAGKAFSEFYGIPVDTTRRYPGTVQDGVLVLDLNQPGTEVTSGRAKKDHGELALAQ